MITLYQFSPCLGVLNASTFCMKLEVYLKLTKLPYEVKYVNNPRKAPKGKLPYIKDGDRVIADSGLIIDYLKATYGDPLDEKLTPAQHAQSIAIQRLLEEHLYWIILYSRWVYPTGWATVKPHFFAKMPPLVQKLMVPVIRKNMIKALYCQGLGRHTAEEIFQLGKDDLTALSALLGKQTFLLSKAKPTSIDASAYACLTNILMTPVESPLKTYAESLKNLVDYCQRMTDYLAND